MSKQQKTYHHGELRQAILHVALEIIEQEGVAALTLREVARRAGVSHTAPYRHFADKQALLAAVAEEGFNALRSAMESRMSSYANPLRCLKESGIAYVLFAATHPAHYRIMFGRALVAQHSHDALRDAGNAAFQVLLRAIAQGHEAKMLRADDPLQQAITAWAAVHGLAMLLINGQLPCNGIDPSQVELLATNTVEALQLGLVKKNS